MSSGEFLQILIDFNLDKFAQHLQDSSPSDPQGSDVEIENPLQIFFDSILKFVNAFQIQNSKNRYRIVLALPEIQGSYKTQVLFPQDQYLNQEGKEIQPDSASLQKFSFEIIRNDIYIRLYQIIENMNQ